MYILSSSSSSSSKYAHIGFASSSCRQASHNIISDCISTHPYYIQLKTKAVPILYCFVIMYYYSSIRAAGSSCCVTEL